MDSEQKIEVYIKWMIDDMMTKYGFEEEFATEVALKWFDIFTSKISDTLKIKEPE